MSSRHRVVGAAGNVSLAGRGAEPFECDADERLLISAYGCTCEVEATLYFEGGDSEP
jgi:hypothetical protein